MILFLIRGSYLLGARVSEAARLQWCDVEPLADGGQIHLLGKGSKARTVRVSADTLQLFESLGRTSESDYLFPSSRTKSHLTRQAINEFEAPPIERVLFLNRLDREPAITPATVSGIFGAVWNEFVVVNLN